MNTVQATWLRKMKLPTISWRGQARDGSSMALQRQRACMDWETLLRQAGGFEN